MIQKALQLQPGQMLNEIQFLKFDLIPHEE